MAAAVIRGFARRSAKTIGNFWVDLTRTTLWVLLPLSLIFALVLVCRGYGQLQPVRECDHARRRSANDRRRAGRIAGNYQGARDQRRRLHDVNSAHPYENPTPLTNLLEMLAIFSIGAGLTHTFGKMVGDRKQGWALFAVMAILFLAGAAPRSGLSNTAIRNSPKWESISTRPRRKAAATWRARRPVSESLSLRCGRP